MVLATDMGVPGDFTNYFMMSVSDEERRRSRPSDFAKMPWTKWQPALELTYNHGTEQDPAFQVHTGTSEPEGFGHIGFLVDDVVAMCRELEELGVPVVWGPGDGTESSRAHIIDPSGYRVQLLQRGAEFDMMEEDFAEAHGEVTVTPGEHTGNSVASTQR